MADATDGTGPCDPAVLRDGYEQLRERVLTGRADGWRLGHALLARRGMAGWIAAQPTVAAPAAAPPAPGAAVAGLAGDCGQIVSVLAAMALAHAA